MLYQGKAKLNRAVRWVGRIVSRCMRSANPPRKGEWRDNARRVVLRFTCPEVHVLNSLELRRAAHELGKPTGPAYLRRAAGRVLLQSGRLILWVCSGRLRRLLLRYSADDSTCTATPTSLSLVLLGVVVTTTRPRQGFSQLFEMRTEHLNEQFELKELIRISFAVLLLVVQAC